MTKRKSLRAAFLELFAGLFVGWGFGFALIGGVWARTAVDEERITQAEERQSQLAFLAAKCNQQAFAIRDSLNALRSVVGKFAR